jgi:hypothetical protein
MNRTLSTRSLATTACVGLALFPTLVVVLNLIQFDQYDPLQEAISVLALGRDGWLMALAFGAAGTGMVSLAVLHRRTVTTSVAAPILLALSGGLTFVSAVVHTDGTNGTTLHGQAHQIAGISSFVLVIAAMFVSSRRFKRDPDWQPLARPTWVWATCAIAAFFLIPILGDGYFGLAQRIFIATWLSWLLVIAVHVRRSTSGVGGTAAATETVRA